MKSKINLFVPVAVFLLSGCGQDSPQTGQESGNQPASTAAVPAGEGGTSLANIASGVYSIDPMHSYLTFSYLHMGYSYPLLRATGIDGELTLNGGAMEESTVAIAIDASTIESGIQRFNTELHSLQYFNVEKYPHITFTSRAYGPTSDVTGRLTGFVTIRGKTRPMTLDVVINNAIIHPMSKKPVIGFTATGELKRSDFDMSRNIPFVADKVTIDIEAEFVEGSSETSSGAAMIAMDTTAGAPPESLIIAAVTTVAAPDSVVPGSYNIVAQNPRGETRSTLTISGDGTGTLAGDRGTTEFSGISFDGKGFSFSLTLSSPVGELEMEYEGLVDGDTIAGTVLTPDGARPFNGERNP